MSRVGTARKRKTTTQLPSVGDAAAPVSSAAHTASEAPTADGNTPTSTPLLPSSDVKLSSAHLGPPCPVSEHQLSTQIGRMSQFSAVSPVTRARQACRSPNECDLVNFWCKIEFLCKWSEALLDRTKNPVRMGMFFLLKPRDALISLLFVAAECLLLRFSTRSLLRAICFLARSFAGPKNYPTETIVSTKF